MPQKSLILFIHGLGGDAKGTWGAFGELIEADEALRERFDVQFWSYPTRLWRTILHAMSPLVEDLSGSLRTAINSKFSAYECIILVAHSLGGLVARKYVVEEVKAGTPLRVRGMLLYAVPNEGSDFAFWGSLISWRHKHLLQIRKKSEFLRSLRNDWQKLKCAAHLKVHHVAGAQDRIVSRDSSHAAWAEATVEVIADCGHGDIVKPEAADDDAFCILRTFLEDVCKGEERRERAASISPAPELPAPDPLFHFYAESHERYYLPRREDEVIAAYLGHNSLWVTGPTGCGKTVALVRALERRGIHHHVVALGHLSGLDGHGLIRGFAAKLADLRGATMEQRSEGASELIELIVRELSLAAERGVGGLLIEEIPFPGEDDFEQWLGAMRAALIQFASLPGARPLRLLFSSISDPRALSAGNHKTTEILKVISFLPWGPVELEGLARRVASAMELDVTDHEFQLLIQKADGSPRFVKVFFGNLVVLRAASASTFEEVLQLTAQEMGA
jgi:predicted alpha/beta hydrolase family esterase